MPLVMIFTSYVQNLNVHSNKMAEKAMFESIKSGTSLLKEKTFSEKAEQRAVITFCTGIGKKLLLTLTHFCKGRQEFEPFPTIQVAQNVFRRKEHVIDDVWEGSPSFRNCGTVKNEVRDVIDGD